MTAWAFLAAAIGCEVAATVALRAAAHGSRGWYGPVAVGYVAAFGFLALALDQGMALGVAYGAWTAIGLALTTLIGWLAFREPLNRPMLIGLVLIMIGVVLVELGAPA